MARCLDGSPGGFWFSPGVGADASKWIVHFQGGGWCGDEQECLTRSQTSLGSSTFWNATGCPNIDGGDHGILSANATINTYMSNWTKVFIGYCDGGSYAGTVTDPISVNGKPVYFRGRYIMDAIIQDLTALGMGTASDVLLKGCSAGGLATYLHCDYWGGLLSPTTNFKCAPGAGFFLDVYDYQDQPRYTPIYQYVAAMQNVSGSVNSDCAAYYSDPDDAWHCFMAPYTLPFISTPLFVSNSLYDAWQMTNIMNLQCDPATPGSCSSNQLTYFNAFRDVMINQLQPLFTREDTGAFLQSCIVHVVEGIDYSWNGTVVAGQRQLDTLWSWWTGGKDPRVAGISRFAVDGIWGTQNTCYANYRNPASVPQALWSDAARKAGPEHFLLPSAAVEAWYERHGDEVKAKMQAQGKGKGKKQGPLRGKGKGKGKGKLVLA